MRKNVFTRLFALLLGLMFCISLAIPTFAAQVDAAVLDPNAECSLTIYNYDYTTALKNTIWNPGSYVSTGKFDNTVVNTLGAGSLAIEGAEFSYLKVAEVVQFNGAGNQIKLLYKFDKAAAKDLLAALGLTNGMGSDTEANTLDSAAWYYASDAITTAMADALTADPVAVKNALENYIQENNGTAMPLTDAAGRTSADGLPVGLYLLVETKVPENTSSTVNPCFISLPMTTIDGTAWNYDVTVYPKNETSVVTLEKQAYTERGSGKNVDVFCGDTVRFEITSTLPTITSSATALSAYTFVDTLAKGLTYDEVTGMQIKLYSDKLCFEENLVETWAADSGMFTCSVSENQDGSHTITVAMTAAGLAELTDYSQHTMLLSYATTVNSDNSVVFGDTGNCNSVTLTWARSSTGYTDTLVDDVHIYSYGIDLKKVFSDGKTDQDLFDQVLFKVQREDNLQYLTAALNETEGIWYITGTAASEADATAFYPVTYDGQPGHLVIEGLGNTTYILTETETADGYTLLKDSIQVIIGSSVDVNRPCTIYSSDTTGVVQSGLEHDLLSANATVNGNQATMAADNKNTESTNALVVLQVTNTRGFQLPDTGDLGVFLLPILGAAGMIGAAALIFLICKRKKYE